MNSTVVIRPLPDRRLALISMAVLLAVVLATLVLPLTRQAPLHPPDRHSSTPHAASGPTLKEARIASLPEIASVPTADRPTPDSVGAERDHGREVSDPPDHPPR